MTLKSKPIIAFIIAIALVVGAVGLYFLWSTNRLHLGTDITDLPMAKSREDTYSLKESDEGLRYENRIDGFAITLPKDAKLSFDPMQLRSRITLANGCQLDIYKTTNIPYGGNADYYVDLLTGKINPSQNCFTNTVDHQIIFENEVRLAGFKGRATQWQRTPLARVEKDMPHYYAVDLSLEPFSAITFFLKSPHALKETEREEINRIIDTYDNRKPEVAPFYQADDSPKRNLNQLRPKTKAVYNKYFSDASSLHWGIFEPSYAAFKYGDLLKLEEALATHFPMIIQYMDLTRVDPKRDLAPVFKQAVAEGRSVELTFQTINEANESNQVYDILNGKLDNELKTLCEVIRQSDVNLLLRVGNEMNGDWCLYSPVHLSRDPDLYIAFYHYLIDFFEKEGVSEQMIYVWNPNAESYPAYRFNNPHLTWPGNRYVDIVGMTAYNTGTYYEGETWQSFDDLYRQPYEDYSRHYKQPLIITEFASSSIGGNKTAWVKDMLKTIETDYPKIKFAFWWNHADYDPDKENTLSRPYYINDSPETVAVFRRYFQEQNQ